MAWRYLGHGEGVSCGEEVQGRKVVDGPIRTKSYWWFVLDVMYFSRAISPFDAVS